MLSEFNQYYLTQRNKVKNCDNLEKSLMIKNGKVTKRAITSFIINGDYLF
jgi:hypothetical protein